MRILTVRQPWAAAIIRGDKNVENRTRNIAGGYRGLVAIHSALLWDSEETGQVALTQDELAEAILFKGHILGVVELTGIHRSRSTDGRHVCFDKHTPTGQLCSTWADGFAPGSGYHLELANARPLSHALRYRGALGLRELPADVTAEIEARL